jgi:chitinase
MVLLSFMDTFPNAGSNMPGTNFAGNCNNGFFPGTQLHMPCAPMPEDIKTCQASGKKVILAIGGAQNYQSPSISQGEQLADWLWGAYGPQSANTDQPRPFESSEVDGFDFDIEIPSAGK